MSTAKFRALTRRFSSRRKEEKMKLAQPLSEKVVPNILDHAGHFEIKPGKSTLPKDPREDSANSSVAPTPSLQGIPGEVRNAIYRMVLVEEGMIRIWRQSHEQPGLLRTNRLLRSEALSIYTNENTFKLDAWNMLLTVPPDYDIHWISRIPSKRLYITMRGKSDWDNLISWWRRYCENKLPGLATGQPTTEAEILAQGFTVVDGLRGKVTFEQMKPSLEAFVKALKLTGRDFNFR